VDDLTARVTLKFTFASFLSSLTSLWGPTFVSPTAVKAHETDGDWAQAWMAENEAGTGPYKLESYERNQQLVMVRNPDYWGGWGDKYLDKIIVRFVSESTTMRLMIEKGDADMAIGMTPEDLDALMQLPGVTVPEYTAQTIVEMRINTTRKPLDDVRVRQALSYSFDYDQAVQGVKSGHAVRMTSVVGEAMPGYYKPSFMYVKDLDKARQLLAEAGYPDGGFSLQYVWIQGLETDRRLGEMWQADLKQLGIELNIQEMPLATWWEAQASPDTAPDTMMGAWTLDYPDATSQLWAMYYSGSFPPAGSNYYFYKNGDVDKLLEQARVEQDPAKRDQLYQQAVEQIYSDAPEIWTIQPTERIAMRTDVKGYEYNFPYSYFYFNFDKMYKE
jgi:peptide/nickel transport system substrate-binding protein